jgi:hypothetical protein
MSAPFFVPFNFQPVSTAKGTGTYTCPAGKYALVTVTLSVEARGNPGAGTTYAYGSSDSSSQVFSVWVAAGQTVQGSLSNASATSASANQASTSATGTASYQVDGVTSGSVRASASAGHGNAVALTSSVTGTSSFHYYAQEFNQLT